MIKMERIWGGGERWKKDFKFFLLNWIFCAEKKNIKIKGVKEK